MTKKMTLTSFIADGYTEAYPNKLNYINATFRRWIIRHKAEFGDIVEIGKTDFIITDKELFLGVCADMKQRKQIKSVFL